MATKKSVKKSSPFTYHELQTMNYLELPVVVLVSGVLAAPQSLFPSIC